MAQDIPDDDDDLPPWLGARLVQTLHRHTEQFFPDHDKDSSDEEQQ